MPCKSVITHCNVVSVVSKCVAHLITQQLIDHCVIGAFRMRSLQPALAYDVLLPASSRGWQPAILRSAENRVRTRVHRTVSSMAVPVLGNPPTFSGPDLPPASELLPCQLDSYARSGTATVLACEAIAPPSKASKPVKAGKAASKGATLVGSSVGEGSGSRQIRLWSITLAGGPLYPEGGGQPSDTGTLHVITAPHPSPDGNDAAGNSAAPAEAGTVTAEGAAAAPQAAVNDNRAAELVSLAARDAQVSETAHVAAVNILTVIRSGRSVLATVDAPLPVGASVAVSVDWARRFDLMQQHTG